MPRALRILVLLGLLALPGCTRAGVLAGVLLARVALTAAVLAGESSHGGGYTPSHDDPEPPGAFDFAAIDGVLTAVLERARGCGRNGAAGPRGPGVAHVQVEPSGKISEVILEAPFAGTQVGDCVAEELFASGIKPYEGAPAMFCWAFVVD